MPDSSSSNPVRSGGIGFCPALFLLFLGLRLAGEIDWAWYWVASPLLIPLGVAAACFVVAGLFLGIVAGYEYFERRARRRRRAADDRARENRTP